MQSIIIIIYCASKFSMKKSELMANLKRAQVKKKNI